MRRFSSSALLLLVWAVAAASCADNLPTAQEKLRTAPSSLIRAEAAERLGDIGCEEAVRTLTLHGLRDSSPMVRAASTRALAAKDHPHVIDLLGELVLDPHMDVRSAAADALAVHRSEKARRYLEIGYARSSSEGRALLADALVTAGASPRRVVEEMSSRRLRRNLGLLETGTQAERVGAIQELGRSGMPDAVSALRVQLGAPALAVAAAAANALGEVGDRTIAPELVKALDEPRPLLRRSVLAALGRLGDPAAADPIADLAIEETSPLASEAVMALSDLDRTDQVRDALCRVAMSARAPAAPGAARLLAERVPGHECDILARARRDLTGDSEAMRGALDLISFVPASALTEPDRERLKSFLDHDDVTLRAKAIDVMRKLEFEEIGPTILDALQTAVDEDRRGRERWVSDRLPAMFGWGDDGSANGGAERSTERMEQTGLSGKERYRGRYEELMERVAGYRADLEVRRRARMGLEEVAVEDARDDHLEALFSDVLGDRLRLFGEPSAADVRYLAALTRAAVSLAGQEAVQPVKGILRHPEMVVRVAAVRSLAETESAETTKLLESSFREGQFEEVLAEAALALSERGEGLEPILRSIPWAGPTARRSIVTALGNLGCENSVEGLAGLLDGPVARDAVRALGKIGGERAARELIRHFQTVDAPGLEDLHEIFPSLVETEELSRIARRGLHSEWAEIRAASAGHLRSAGLTEPWLEALRGDYDARVRRAAERQPR